MIFDTPSFLHRRAATALVAAVLMFNSLPSSTLEARAQTPITDEVSVIRAGAFSGSDQHAAHRFSVNGSTSADASVRRSIVADQGQGPR